MFIDDEINGYKVIITCDNKNKKFHMKIILIAFDLVLVDDYYPNEIMLSADLRDKISFDAASKLLLNNNVPYTHPLWDLNHSGFWQKN